MKSKCRVLRLHFGRKQRENTKLTEILSEKRQRDRERMRERAKTRERNQLGLCTARSDD